MSARIHRPARTAMQSGAAKTKRWLLEFEPTRAREIDPLMGWTSSADTRQQLKLWFDTREEAIAYCERVGEPYQLIEPQEQKRRGLSYSDNFRHDRVGQWTH